MFGAFTGPAGGVGDGVGTGAAADLVGLLEAVPPAASSELSAEQPDKSSAAKDAAAIPDAAIRNCFRDIWFPLPWGGPPCCLNPEFSRVADPNELAFLMRFPNSFTFWSLVAMHGSVNRCFWVHLG